MFEFFKKPRIKEVTVEVPESISRLIKRFAPGVHLLDGEIILAVSDEAYIELHKTYTEDMYSRYYRQSIEQYYGLKLMKETEYKFELAVRAEAKKRLEGK